jgi:beta-phosphoglucomutase
METELKAVIFDFNGVVVDDEPLHFELLQQLLLEEGMALEAAAYQKNYFGFDDRGVLTAALRDFGRPAKASDEAYVRELIERKAARYLEAVRTRDLLFPGVVTLIRNLANRYPLAIVSGALRQEIELALERGDILDCFPIIISTEDVSQCKPDPEGYLKALEALRRKQALDANECLVIEDSIAGIRAARAAGMRCLAVATSYQPQELTEADFVVESLKELDAERIGARG